MIWMPVPSYPGIEASEMGDVRFCGAPFPVKQHNHVTKGGTYKRCHLGNKKRELVHRLVCEAFQGRCPELHECGHADGDPFNNAANNLRWVTRKENAADKERYGRPPRGERAGRARLSLIQVQEILSRSKVESTKELAREFGIKPCTVSNIKAGRIWAEALTDLVRDHR